MTKKQYWKSLKLHGGKIVSDRDKSKWIIGEWRTVPKPIRECKGLNCCEYIQDAMKYVPMNVLAEVEIEGKKIIGNDKLTVEKMRVVRAWKWEKKDSVEFAIFSAELVLPVFEAKYPDDKRPHNAIQAAKDWLENPSESAAEAAARAAADAARAAALAVETARVAEAAAMAASSAASSAAWAASSAAWAAAWAAARAVEDVHPPTKLKIHDWIIGHIPELAEIHRETQG